MPTYNPKYGQCLGVGIKENMNTFNQEEINKATNIPMYIRVLLFLLPRYSIWTDAGVVMEVKKLFGRYYVTHIESQ